MEMRTVSKGWVIAVRLVAFRAERFRSIEDSGKCYVSADVTALAGKNESGKTNLLAALQHLDGSVAFGDDDRPYHCEGAPRLTYWLTMTPSDEKRLGSSLGVGCKIAGLELVVVREPGHPGVSLEGPVVSELERAVGPGNPKADISGMVLALVKEYTELSSALADLNEDPVLAYKEVVQYVSEHPEAVSPELEASLGQIGAAVEAPTGPERVKAELCQSIPHPVYFDSFADELPDSLRIADAVSGKSRIVRSFCSVAGISLDELKVLQAGDPYRRTQLATVGSDKYVERFQQSWEQEQVTLTLNLDGEYMVFTVKSPNIPRPFRPSQRSKGFRWFTSFFLTVASQIDEFGEDVIVLIDEPGLYMHAKAQAQVLDLFERISGQSQIVFTTHSPYLLDPARLDRIRLVTKGDPSGTVVRNSVFYGADDDTMTPVITALGLDLARSWGTPRARNLIVEGPSDYYYIESMRQLAGQENLKDVAVVPCVGHTTVGTLASLLIGWGLGICIVVDEKGTRGTRGKLSAWLDPSKILVAGKQPGDSVEDLFDPADFDKIVGLAQPSAARPTGCTTNSDWVKTDKLNKLALSRQLAQAVRESKIKLSKTTIQNFTDLLSRVGSALGGEPPVSAKRAEMPTGAERPVAREGSE